MTFPFLESLRPELVVGLFALAFIVHDAEEILTWSWWMRRHGRHIFAGRLAGRLQNVAGQTTGQFTVAVAVILVAALAATYSGLRALANGGPLTVFAGALAVMFLHTFAHLATSLRYRSYSPGVVTGVIICIPYPLLAAAYLMQAGLLDWPVLGLGALLGVAVAVPLLLAAHGVGRLLAR